MAELSPLRVEGVAGGFETGLGARFAPVAR